MNIFQLIKTVLDELYNDIQATNEEEKDNLINQRIKALKPLYSQLAYKKENLIDYSDQITKFAYVHTYVTSHASLVYQVIQKSKDIENLLQNNKIRVTCLGGGPGSDFLGILKYLIKKDFSPDLTCFLYDKESSWNECWMDVHDKLKSQLRINTNCQPFDITNQQSWSTSFKALRTSDLFTMIYFMSEVYWAKQSEDQVTKDSIDNFFERLFNEAKPGSLFLYVDNNSKEFYGWFSELAKKFSCEILLSKTEETFIQDTDEEKKDLGIYFEKFGSPKIKAKIHYYVCRKIA